MTGPLTLTVFDPALGVPTDQPLPNLAPGDHAHVSLSRIPGGAGVHLRITEPTTDGPRVHRMEIPAGYDPDVSLVVSWITPGRVVVRSPGRETFYLPPDPSYGPEAVEWIGGPVPPILIPADAVALDLAFLVDATTRRWWRDKEERPMSGLLLEAPAEWAATVDQLLELADRLAFARTRVRVAILAFADERPSLDSPEQLKPKFLLHPPDALSRQLSERPPAKVHQSLVQIPASTGADYVDALGEGLQAAGSLTWHPAARRILIVVGDSPGYSVVAPAPWGADARVRTVDVDTEVARLHRRGVEVVTIFAGPPREFGFHDPGKHSELLLRHAREQYQRLASTERYSAELDGFDPAALAQAILDTQGPIARGPTWPCFVSASAVSLEAARRLAG